VSDVLQPARPHVGMHELARDAVSREPTRIDKEPGRPAILYSARKSMRRRRILYAMSYLYHLRLQIVP
jgi:hypothetical protein